MINYFQQEDAIKISQSRLDEFCIKHHFPKLKIKSVIIQENIRLLHAVAIPCWETECLQKTGYIHVLQHREARAVVRKIIRKHLWPLFEQQYHQSIRHSDYKLIYLDGQYQLFSITIFEKPVLSKADADIRSIEDQHAGLLAKKLRDLTGRGPKKTKAICMNPGLMFYLINGLISKGDKLFASRSMDNADHVEKIVEYNLQQAFGAIYTTNDTAINKVNIIDLDNDFAFSLIFLESEEFSIPTY